MAQKSSNQRPLDAIPERLLEDDRIGIVGTAGSGKTYTAKGAVEQLIASDARVCVVDPLGVWWGLRASVDGNPDDGLPVTIFGGLHADVPISEHSGDALASIVASTSIRCIVDLSELGSAAARRRFMTDFIGELYARNRAPLHLVLDEADMWSPQRPLPDQHVLQAKMNEIVRRGRVRGFVPWLISQRPAVIDKDVLSQIDTLIAMKLTSSQDRDALMAWVEGQADREDGRRIRAELPKLQRGTGYLWAPAHGLLELVHFRPITTFDSSKTPKRGEKAITATLKPMDTAAMRRLLEEKVVPGGPANVPTKVPQVDVARIRQEAWRNGYAAGVHRGKQALCHVMEHVAATADRSRAAMAMLDEPIPAQRPPVQVADTISGGSDKPLDLGDPYLDPARHPLAPSGTKLVVLDPYADGKLHAAAKAILAVLAKRAPARFTWAQAATLAGLKPRGGHFNAGAKQLREEGLIEEHGEGLISASPEGSHRIGIVSDLHPESPEEIRQLWIAKLPSPAPEMLRALARRPMMTITELAHELGKLPRGGHWNAGMKMLRDNGLATVNSGTVHLAGALRG